ncbi:hypothetical protein ACQP1S_00200 [Micromonospora matsumotoense]|uniref:hypothetical protein n=1 Tax=Micromonospora matsumotoense TaxID=121616 RepID=UPI003D945233
MKYRYFSSGEWINVGPCEWINVGPGEWINLADGGGSTVRKVGINVARGWINGAAGEWIKGMGWREMTWATFGWWAAAGEGWPVTDWSPQSTRA